MSGSWAYSHLVLIFLAFIKGYRRCLKNDFSFSREVLLSQRSPLGCPAQLQCYSNAHVWSWTLLVWIQTLAVTGAPVSQPILGLSPGRAGAGMWASATQHWNCSHMELLTHAEPWLKFTVCSMRKKKKLHPAKRRIIKELINWSAYYIVAW